MATKKIEFKRGDLVFVERKVERRSRDFQNKWTSEMNKFIGETFEVEEVRPYGVMFKGIYYGFPPSALRLIRRDGMYQFKAGDIVKVERAMPEHPLWQKSMNDAVGNTYTVTRTDTDNTASLGNAFGISLWFPCEVLKLVGKESKYKNAPKPTPTPTPTQPIVLEAWERF